MVSDLPLPAVAKFVLLRVHLASCLCIHPESHNLTLPGFSLTCMLYVQIARKHRRSM